MAALFVNLFKMHLRQFNGKEVSQNMAQIAKNFFFRFTQQNVELSRKTKLTINLATLDKLWIFVNLVLIFETFLIT